MSGEKQEHRTAGINITSPGVMVIDSGKEMIVGASSNFASMVGYTEDEVNGMSVRVIHPGDMDALLRGVNRAQRDGISLTTGLTCRTKDGYHVPVDVHYMRLFSDGRLMAGIIVPVDKDPSSEVLGPLTSIATGIVHDVNNLLNVASGRAQILSAESPEKSEILNQITVSIQKAGELMQRFMRVVHADATDDPYVELSPHLKEMESLLQSVCAGALPATER